LCVELIAAKYADYTIYRDGVVSCVIVR